MATIETLIAQVADPALRERLADAVSKMKARLDWGLVFERHLPERALLLSGPIRVGTAVWERKSKKPRRLRIRSVEGDELVVAVEPVNTTAPDDAPTERIDRADVLIEHDLSRPIYPLLQPLGEIRNGPSDRPAHAVIRGENFDALQVLLATHPSSFDLIYLDPPYNTGDRDWAYNNNYIDPNDTYRSSKWLAFMERRLTLAQRLLRPDGIVVVAVDKNEHAHLVMLLEQMFPGRDITSIAIQHNPRGVQGDNFSYTNEFAVFVVPGKNRIAKREIAVEDRDSSDLRDHGGESLRTDAATCFYPILVKGGAIIGFGDVPADDWHPSSVNVERSDGSVEVWPLDVEGVERKWRYSRKTVEDIRDWLTVVEIKRGKKPRFDIKITKPMGSHRTMWFGSRYDAGTHGTKLIRQFADADFSYPKSIYNLRDVIEAASGGRTDISILDFFAGSGTTLHATMLLNAEDGGNRRCILITNNEVRAKVADSFAKRGIFQGDPEWEKRGVFESATRPRALAAISGRRPDGAPLDGTYLDDGGRPRGRAWSAGFEENCVFYGLDYHDGPEIEFGWTFAEMGPLLWFWAGGIGDYVPMPNDRPFAVASASPYAVLFSPAGLPDLLTALDERSDITHVFIVADSQDTFVASSSRLPDRLTRIRLYADYLSAVRSAVR